MAHALALGRRGLGRVAPNPAVGCVLVRDGLVVGRGWTQPGGRPHAETMALAQAGDAARGATAYVTLEPCSHHGETGPCAEALIAAGVGRVVMALGDPDTRVSGRGIAMLREAGVQVEENVSRDAAAALNRGFLLNRTAGRPLVTMKLATSADGRIATATGHAQWITGPEARRMGHLLRAGHDAILTGAGTVAADDPELTCRLEGLTDRSPVRVVMDTGLSLSPDSKLAKGARDVPVILFCGPVADPAKRAALHDRGVSIIETDRGSNGRPDPAAVLNTLAASGVTRLLLEAGALLSAAFIASDLVDRIEFFRSGKVIGGDGLAAIGGFGLADLSGAPRFVHAATRRVGDDVLETWTRAD